MKRFSIFTITFLLCISAMTACNSAAENLSSNSKTIGEAEQQKSPSIDNKIDNKMAENKAAENKVSEEKSVEIYDGRKDFKSSEPAKTEKDSVEKEVKSKEAAIKEKNNTECENDNFSVGSALKGSFTKPNSSQTAYLYSLCDNGSASSPSGIGGIMIFDADKPIAHYSYEYIGSENAVSLPDINKNGLSEIGLINEDGGQGLRSTNLIILEFKEGNLLKFIGSTQVGSVSFNSTSSNETVDKIYVETSANPIFFRETYQKKNGAKDWALLKKSEKFTLMPEGKSSTVFIKIN